MKIAFNANSKVRIVHLKREDDDLLWIVVVQDVHHKTKKSIGDVVVSWCKTRKIARAHAKKIRKAMFLGHKR